MIMSDPIADMLKRIRNAHHADISRVDIPASGPQRALAEVLKVEGYKN